MKRLALPALLTLGTVLVVILYADLIADHGWDVLAYAAPIVAPLAAIVVLDYARRRWTRISRHATWTVVLAASTIPCLHLLIAHGFPLRWIALTGLLAALTAGEAVAWNNDHQRRGKES